MTIPLKQLAHAVNTGTRIIPLRIIHCTVFGEESWVLRTMSRDPVMHVYPCAWYTSEEAVSAYCELTHRDPENVITQYEEE